MNFDDALAALSRATDHLLQARAELAQAAPGSMERVSARASMLDHEREFARAFADCAPAVARHLGGFHRIGELAELLSRFQEAEGELLAAIASARLKDEVRAQDRRSQLRVVNPDEDGADG